MSQDKVLHILFLYRNKNQWLTSKEIADKLDLSLRSVTVALRSLVKHKEVFHRIGKFRRMEFKFRFNG